MVWPLTLGYGYWIRKWEWRRDGAEILASVGKGMEMDLRERETHTGWGLRNDLMGMKFRMAREGGGAGDRVGHEKMGRRRQGGTWGCD